MIPGVLDNDLVALLALLTINPIRRFLSNMFIDQVTKLGSLAIKSIKIETEDDRTNLTLDRLLLLLLLPLLLLLLLLLVTNSYYVLS